MNSSSRSASPLDLSKFDPFAISASENNAAVDIKCLEPTAAAVAPDGNQELTPDVVDDDFLLFEEKKEEVETTTAEEEKGEKEKGEKEKEKDIATSDEEWSPAQPPERQPLVPYPRQTVANRLAQAVPPVHEVVAVAEQLARLQLREAPESAPAEERSCSPPSTPESRGHWTGLATGGQYSPQGYHEEPWPATEDDQAKADLALAAVADSQEEEPKLIGPRFLAPRFRKLSPRTVALLDQPIPWDDEVEEERRREAEPAGDDQDVVVEGAVGGAGPVRSLSPGEEAVQLLDEWQHRILTGLERAFGILQDFYVKTTLPRWEKILAGNWAERRYLIEGISLYRRVAFRAHVLDDLGAFNEEGGCRIQWLLNQCRDLLRTLELPLLVIEAEDLDGWASYDPPRASAPTIYGKVVWPERRRRRTHDE